MLAFLEDYVLPRGGCPKTVLLDDDIIHVLKLQPLALGVTQTVAFVLRSNTVEVGDSGCSSYITII